MMGCFDTLSEGDFSSQVKCFGGDLKIFRKGERVPTLHCYEDYEEWPEEEQIDTYTIVLPGYESHKFALIKDRIFIGFTNHVSQTIEPYIAKWGERLEKLDDFVDFFTELVQSSTGTPNLEPKEQ